MPQLKITYKMAIILATMSFGPLLIGNLAGLFSDNTIETQRVRTEISRQVATGCSSHIAAKDHIGLQRACVESLRTVQDLRSLRVLRHDGLVLYASPGHDEFWNLPVESPSTLDQVRVPLMRGSAVVAELEIAFKHSERSVASQVIHWLLVVVVGFALNFGSFSLFLNKALSVLDPKSAVPKRVRNTLDTIVGGVVILDSEGKILLVNDSFTKYVSMTMGALTNKLLNELSWVHDEGQVEWPWEFVIREKMQRAGIKLHLLVNQQQRTFMVNATPVFDSQERISGALISFEDITLMEEQRRHLLSVLSDLETSKEQIRRQNEVLHELATRDGLTGALNRRAIFEKIDTVWENRNNGDRGLVTILMDVDHFKKLNDQFGHSAGDAVLKDLVKTVSRIVEGRGILGRYGGEEFCVIMTQSTIEEGQELAEAIRAGIQLELADPYKVTASLGVSSSLFGAPTIQNQIEQSDQGLYAAKHGGRNGWRVWSSELEETLKEEERKKAAKLASWAEEEQPISYHAVVTLNATLSSRYPMVAMHGHRVSEICLEMAREHMPVGKLYTLEIASTLHEVGCLAMSDEDYAAIGNDAWCHPERLQRIVKETMHLMQSSFRCPELLEMLEYQATPFNAPGAVSGTEIPEGARIIYLAKAYDSLTSERSLAPKTHAEAMQILRLYSGMLFDPILLDRLESSSVGKTCAVYIHPPGITDKTSLMIGFQLERLIHSYQSGNAASLKMRLDSLQMLTRQLNMPVISDILQELRGEAERKAVADWGSLLPTLQDLIETCLIIQRAYLRSAVRVSHDVDGKTNAATL